MPDAQKSETDVKAERRVALEIVDAYHREQLGLLLDHVRQGFTRLEAGEIDEFELDELIHRYKKAAAKLWTFCSPSGASVTGTAQAINRLNQAGEARAWWQEAESRRDRSK